MIRKTKQRSAILNALKSENRPLSSIEIYDIGKKFTSRLGLRTVYRNINELQYEGKIVSLDYPGQPIRYELITPDGHHSHFICYYCKKVFDFHDEIPDIKYVPPAGFKIEGEEIVFYGRCPDCHSTATSNP